eukprot:7925082-Ditylum_brightwellii.AAC.1
MTALARNSFAAMAFAAVIYQPLILTTCVIVLLATWTSSGGMTCGCGTSCHPFGMGMYIGGVHDSSMGCSVGITCG